MAKDIRIIPASGLIAFSGSNEQSTITVADDGKIALAGSGSTIFDIQGSQGQLFSVTDSLVGSLFSVNDISGIPILEVFDTDKVVMGTFGQNTLVVTGSKVGIGKDNPSVKLEVEGAIKLGQTSDFPTAGITHYTNSYLYIKGGASGAAMGNQSFGSSVYVPNDNTVQFVAGSTERMRITSDGDVGIGTTSPGTELDVRGTIRSMKAQTSTAFTDPFLKLFPNATTNTTGLTSITLGTSPVDNYGVSLSGWRYGTDGTPKFVLKMHNNSAAGLSALTVDHFGRVGIGTTTPTANLQVGDNAVSTTSVFNQYTGTAMILNSRYDTADKPASPLLAFTRGTGTSPVIGGISVSTSTLYINTDGGKDLSINSSGSTVLTTAANEDILINPGSGGNVGIGTTTPGRKLHVVDTNPQIKVSYSTATDPRYAELSWGGISVNAGNSANAFAITMNGGNSSNGHINFFTGPNGSPTEKMRITQAGNVGIGTSSPSEKLEVNGNVKLTNAISTNFTAGVSGFSIESGDANYTTYRFDSNKFRFYSGNGGEIVSLTEAGNLGIGNTGPRTTLEVGGWTNTPSGVAGTALSVAGPTGWIIKPTELNRGVNGALYTEPNSTFGYAISASAAGGTNGQTMFFGPYRTLAPGTYTAYFRMKVADNSSTATLITLDVFSSTLEYNNAVLLSPSDFGYSNEWELISLPFSVSGSTTNIEFRGLNYNTGITDLYIDHVAVHNTDIRGYYAPNFGITRKGQLAVGKEKPTTGYALDVSGNVGIEGDLEFTKVDGIQIKAKESMIFTIDSDNNDTGRIFQFKDGSGATLMRIGDEGNVGIGTTSPVTGLDVRTSAYSNTTARFGDSRPVYIINQDPIIGFNAYYDNGWKHGTSGHAAYIGASGGSGHIYFYTGDGQSKAADAAMVANERMRINSNGNVLIGTTTDAGYRLRVNGNAYFDGAATFATTAYVGGNLTVGGIVTAQEFHTEFVSASIIYQSGSTQFGNSADDTHIFTGNVTVKGGAPTPETTDGYGLEIMGNYTDGRWNHRFVKSDEGGGVPLYVQKTTTTANTWSNSARFGSYSGNDREFEVFGNAGVTGNLRADSLTATDDLYLTGIYPRIWLQDTDHNSDYSIINSNGTFTIYDDTNAGYRFNITSTGDVGIGTSSPQSRLHVVGDATANTGEILAEFRNSNNDARIDIRDEDGANSRPPGVHSPVAGFGLGLYASATNAPVIFYAGGIGSERMRISGVEGNVGINTTAPGERLDVVGNIRSYSAANNYGQIQNGSFLAVGNHGGTFMLDLDNNGTADLVNIKKSGTSRFYIENGGNVGIGNTTPGVKLDVRDGQYSNARRLLVVDNSNSGTLSHLSYDTVLIQQNDAPTLRLYESGETLATTLASDAGVSRLASSGDLAFHANGTHTAQGWTGLGGNETMRITSNKVGIGTTNPVQKLHVEGNGRFGIGSGADQHIGIFYGNGGSDYGAIRFYQNGSNVNTIHSFSTGWQSNNPLVSGGSVNITGVTATTIGDWNDPDVVVRNGGTTYFKRNVGILTSDTNIPLDVAGNARLGGRFLKGYGTVMGTSGSAKYLGTADLGGNGSGGAATFELYDGHQKTWRRVEVTIQNAGGTNNLSYSVEGGGRESGITAVFAYINRSGDATKTDFFFIPTAGKSYTQIVYSKGSLIEDSGYTSTGATEVDLDGKLTIFKSDSGDVGIGTNSPSAKLEIAAGAGGNLKFGEASGYNAISLNGTLDIANYNILSRSADKNLYINRPTGNNIYFREQNTSQMTIEAGGNVGIGTENPSQKLEVHGNIYGYYGELRLIQGYGITWNNGDNYIRGTSGYSLQFTTYDGSAAQVEVMRLTGGAPASGGQRVGIGTSTPAAKLQVVGGADVVNIEGSGSTANTSIFSIDGNNGRLFEVSDDLSDSLFSVNTIAGLPVLEVFADNRIVAGAYNQNDFVISGSRVGIGTDAPEAILHVGGGTVPSSVLDGMLLTSPSNGQYYQASDGTKTIFMGIDTSDYGILGTFTNHALGFRTNNSEKMRILTNGNVGINRTTAAYRLDVAGNARFNDILNLAGGQPRFQLEETDTTDTNYEILVSGGILFFRTANDAFNSFSNRFSLTQAGTLTLHAYGAGYLKTDASGVVSANANVNAADLTGTYPDLFDSDTRYNIGYIDGTSGNSRDKLRVWNSSTYTIGMKNGYDYGHLGSGEYAMSFQMSSDPGRGWWWGKNTQTDDQGVMALTTGGRLNVATSVSIGEGQTTTSPSTTPLYVEGSGSTILDVQGSQGQLFSVTDSLVGSLFSVNDISGIPILEVFDTDKVVAGTFGQNTLVVTGSRVGIGTDTPAYKFDVRTSEYPAYFDSTGTDYILGLGRNNTSEWWFKAYTDGRFALHENGVGDQVTVKAGGNVGINTTNPSTKLHINLGDGGINGVAGIKIGSTVDYPSLELGTYGTYGGMVRSFGNDLHYFSGHWRTIGVAATENHSHYWYTSRVGSTDWSTVKMELDHNGNLGIGTTDPSAKLHVVGHGEFYSGIGANDDVRTGIVHYDTTAQAANVGGQLVLGYKYHDNGSYTEGAIIKMYKLNSTSGDYSSGLKFQVRNSGAALSTKMTLDPSGVLSTNNGNIVLRADSIENHVTNGNAPIVFNYYGYNTGHTQFRDTLFYNGKGSHIMTVQGSTSRVGIGTTAPAAYLQIGGGTSSTSNRSSVAMFTGASAGGVVDVLNLVNNASAAFGNGTALNFNNASNYSPTGRIIVQQVPSGTITDASMIFQVYQSGLKEALKLNPNQSVTFNESFTFPTGDGSAGQVLQTNGSGTVSWATISSGGTVDGSGAANKVAYWSDADTLTSATNFHFSGTSLGIGTASPSYYLHVDNDAANTNNPALYVRNPNSSTAAVIAEFVGDSDSIQIKNIGTGDYAILNTQQSNGVHLYDGTGGVEIRYAGNTVLEADSAGGIKVTGQMSATGDVIAYSSDERLKENIKPIENAVDKVKQMRGVTFDWNDKSEELGFEPTSKTNDVGVIAQEVEKVFPQLIAHAPFDADTDEEGNVISKSGEDYKTVNYSRLTAVLIEAIKEQQTQIDELKSEIQKLKGE